jgi:CP family cyanate transporter-like MFS transporter
VTAKLVLLWLFGLCLRLTVLAIPPVIPLIHESIDLTQATVGALMSLPVLLFSFAAIPGSLMVARFGPAHVLTVGLLLTAVAAASRGLAPGAGVLFVATFAMGVGIAIMQPALPAVVREWAPNRVALGTAVYLNGLLVGEALSASLTIPVVLPLVGNSWRASLVAWAVPVLVIGLLSAFASRGEKLSRVGEVPRLWWPDWRDPMTWKLGLLSGFSSSLYFATNAFLPDYLRWRGHPELLGSALTALNWAQLLASFLLVVFAERMTLRRWPFVATGILSTIAIVGLLAMQDAWIPFWSAVIGFCTAFILILALALPALLGKANDVHRQSAAMMAIGYLCAFVLPIVGGLAWDAMGSPHAAFAPILLFAIVATFLATRLAFPKARERE